MSIAEAQSAVPDEATTRALEVRNLHIDRLVPGRVDTIAVSATVRDSPVARADSLSCS